MLFLIKMLIYSFAQGLRKLSCLPIESIEVKTVNNGTNTNFLYRTTIGLGATAVNGYGEASCRFEAIAKSMSESFERLAFLNFRNSENDLSQSSSGWAAHVTKRLCKRAASDELLERDAGMVHWLTETPYFTIKDDTLPADVIAKLQVSPKRYHNIKLLLSTAGYVPTLSWIFLDDQGFGVMSHSYKHSFDNALDKAISEAVGLLFTAEKMSVDSHYHSNDQDKAVHAQLRTFSQDQPIPTWVFGSEIDFDTAKKIFYEHLRQSRLSNVDFEIKRAFPLYVGKATSKDLQKHYWGSTEKAIAHGKINYGRIGNHKLSLQPHFVL